MSSQPFRTGASAVLTLGGGQQLRIVHINLDLDEDALDVLYEQGINDMWIVEPADGSI